MHFDWFQATVLEPQDRLLQWLDATYSDCSRTDDKGHNRYDRRADYSREGILLASVSYGGPNGWPNIKATSSAAPRLAEALRASFDVPGGQVRVTRLDACQDFEEEGVFERLQQMMFRHAQRHNIQTEHVGDYDTGRKGRSYYLGAKQSAFRVVGYEKGKQIEQILLATDQPLRPNLVRLEGRYRPQNTMAKVVAASMEPADIWRCCRWGPPLLKSILSIDVERLKMSEYKVPNELISQYEMVKQYYRIIANMIVVADHDPERFGMRLMEIHDSIRRRLEEN